jgi:hypothetical protein
MTKLELELVDAATRKVEADVLGMLATLAVIRAEHRRFLEQMSRLKRSAKACLSK